jgi:hypothetical protein
VSPNVLGGFLIGGSLQQSFVATPPSFHRPYALQEAARCLQASLRGRPSVRAGWNRERSVIHLVHQYLLTCVTLFELSMPLVPLRDTDSTWLIHYRHVMHILTRAYLRTLSILHLGCGMPRGMDTVRFRLLAEGVVEVDPEQGCSDSVHQVHDVMHAI